MKRLNDMFHIEDEQLIKTSNGQPVPDDEPLFILRGRDAMAMSTLRWYLSLCHVGLVEHGRIEQLRAVIKEFQEYANTHAERMKQPGCTKGK